MTSEIERSRRPVSQRFGLLGGTVNFAVGATLLVAVTLCACVVPGTVETIGVPGCEARPWKTTFVGFEDAYTRCIPSEPENTNATCRVLAGELNRAGKPKAIANCKEDLHVECIPSRCRGQCRHTARLNRSAPVNLVRNHQGCADPENEDGCLLAYAEWICGCECVDADGD